VRSTLERLSEKLSNSIYCDNSALKNFLTLANEALVNPERLVLGMTELKEELINSLKNNISLNKNSRVTLKKLSCVFTLCKITEGELRAARATKYAKPESSVNLTNCMNSS